jgi:cobalt-zinc-cadmium efflux system protein
VLIAISALIGREAVARLFHPEPVRSSVMLVAAAAAFLANVGSVLLLRTHSAEDINVRSAFLHLAQDALASLAVVVAALFARTAAGRYVDPAVAILIGVVVLRSAISIVSESLHTLLEVEAIAAEVRRFLHEEWGITHATLEAEANGCGREDLLGDWK